jgi:hypothetical protein
LIAGTAIDIRTIGQGLLDRSLIPGSNGIEQQIARSCYSHAEAQH